MNLRTRRRGIFPAAYVVDVDYTDFDPDGVQTRKERYMLQYLGSVETTTHKGEQVSAFGQIWLFFIFCLGSRKPAGISRNPD